MTKTINQIKEEINNYSYTEKGFNAFKSRVMLSFHIGAILKLYKVALVEISVLKKLTAKKEIVSFVDGYYRRGTVSYALVGRMPNEKLNILRCINGTEVKLVKDGELKKRYSELNDGR